MRSERMLRAGLGCVGTLVALVVYVVSFYVGGLRQPISCEQIRSLAPGMSIEEVLVLVGYPWARGRVSDDVLDYRAPNGLPGHEARGIDVQMFQYAQRLYGTWRQDTLTLLFHQRKLFIVRSHREYPWLAPFEAFVLDRDPLTADAPIVRREGPMFTSLFSCAHD